MQQENVCDKIMLNIALRIEDIKYCPFYMRIFCEQHINPCSAFHVSKASAEIRDRFAYPVFRQQTPGLEFNTNWK